MAKDADCVGLYGCGIFSPATFCVIQHSCLDLVCHGMLERVQYTQRMLFLIAHTVIAQQKNQLLFDQ
jgi:hypothetical protein